jgi:hypothetical protein
VTSTLPEEMLEGVGDVFDAHLQRLGERRFVALVVVFHVLVGDVRLGEEIAGAHADEREVDLFVLEGVALAHLGVGDARRVLHDVDELLHQQLLALLVLELRRGHAIDAEHLEVAVLAEAPLDLELRRAADRAHQLVVGDRNAKAAALLDEQPPVDHVVHHLALEL